MLSIRRCLVWPIAVGLLSQLGVAQEAGDKDKKPVFVPKITVSKETTWFTEPLRENGFVDYLAALNQHFGRGVTVDNNAVVSLYRAMGPRPEGGQRQPDEFFQWLHMEPLPDEGPYFQSLGKWWQSKQKKVPAAGMNAVFDMQMASYSRPWKEEEFPELAEWLRDNDTPLNHVVEGVGRPEYFSPLVSADGGEGKLIQVLLPGVQMSRDLARALTARAMLRLSEGNRFSAWRDLIVVHRLGRLVGRGPTMIEGLVGIAIESMAIEGELRVISDSQPPPKQVALFVKQLQSLPPRATMIDKVDVCERCLFLDVCLHVARGTMDLNEVADGNAGDGGFAKKFMEAAIIQTVEWDDVLKSGNRWYDRLVAAGRKPNYQARMEAFRQLDTDLKELAKRRQGAAVALAILGGKPAITQFTSDVLISLVLPATQQACRAEHRIIQRQRNLEIALALSAWRGEHDAYPETLDDLVPKYLPAIPTDLFNDKPLHFERTADGYRFYSVGENEKDDQGRSFDDKPSGDDLVVQMPKPLPKPGR